MKFTKVNKPIKGNLYVIFIKDNILVSLCHSITPVIRPDGTIYEYYFDDKLHGVQIPLADVLELWEIHE